VKNFGGNSVFRASASCSKILNMKSIFTTVKIFRATLLFSGQAQVAQKSWIWKVYSLQWKFSEQLCYFHGKSKLLKNRELWKNVQYNVYSLGGIGLPWFSTKTQIMTLFYLASMAARTQLIYSTELTTEHVFETFGKELPCWSPPDCGIT